MFFTVTELIIPFISGYIAITVLIVIKVSVLVMNFARL